MAAGTNYDPNEEATKETKMEMTPMIDVTFLLLIFFLCTIKFKILEGKIPAYLPKDVGVNTTPVDKQLEKIEIMVTRTKGLEECMREAEASRGKPKAWVWHENQINISVNGRRIRTLNEFYQLIEGLVKPYKDGNVPLDEWPKATFYPTPGSLYIDSVKVINECLRANFTQITFAGAPADA